MLAKKLLMVFCEWAIGKGEVDYYITLLYFLIDH